MKNNHHTTNGTELRLVDVSTRPEMISQTSIQQQRALLSDRTAWPYCEDGAPDAMGATGGRRFGDRVARLSWAAIAFLLVWGFLSSCASVPRDRYAPRPSVELSTSHLDRDNATEGNDVRTDRASLLVGEIGIGPCLEVGVSRTERMGENYGAHAEGARVGFRSYFSLAESPDGAAPLRMFVSGGVRYDRVDLGYAFSDPTDDTISGYVGVGLEARLSRRAAMTLSIEGSSDDRIDEIDGQARIGLCFGL